MTENITNLETEEALYQAGFNPDGTVTRDLDQANRRYSPVCLLCRHFDPAPWLKNLDLRCKAFPNEGIPLEIWNGDNPHTEPHKGDHGVQFEGKEHDPTKDPAAT